MYRVVRRTNSRTTKECLKCKFCNVLRYNKYQCTVQCLAPNKVLTEPFDANDFYCTEHRGFNDMTPYEIEQLRKEGKV